MSCKRLLIPALLSLVVAFSILAMPAASSAGVFLGVSVSIAPPPLPVYDQPPIPGPGYLWTPGYWAWDPEIGYYWVPGTWVLPPSIGLLWTPGYWDWDDGLYVWNEGYWGPTVGFYGGIDYGFGYTGFGYLGGYWRGDRFFYNRTVNNINITNIRNVYTRNVSNVRPFGASFNGGAGGTTARPTSLQLAAARQKRFSAISAQTRQMSLARTDPSQRATVNRGIPAVAATARPGAFTGNNVVRANRASAPWVPRAGSAVSGSTRTPRAFENRRPATMPENRTTRNERVFRNNELRSAPQSKGFAHQPGTPSNVTPRNERVLRNNDLRSTNRGFSNQPSAPFTAPHANAAPRNERFSRPNELRSPNPGVAHQPNISHTPPRGPEVRRDRQG